MCIIILYHNSSLCHIVSILFLITQFVIIIINQKSHTFIRHPLMHHIVSLDISQNRFWYIFNISIHPLSSFSSQICSLPSYLPHNFSTGGVRVTSVTALRGTAETLMVPNDRLKKSEGMVRAERWVKRGGKLADGVVKKGREKHIVGKERLERMCWWD